MGIFVQVNYPETLVKLKQLGFNKRMGIQRYYQLLTRPDLILRGCPTKPKQKGSVFISEKELDQLILMVNLGLSVDESIKGVVRSKFIKD